MISVIIPVHNAEKYLDRCVKSVLENTYKELEILLIENGSTDSSLELCRKYEMEDARVQVYVASKANVSHARNIGLKHAGGSTLRL